MAGPVYLFLRVNGVAVEGESTETSLGRHNAIECLDYRQGVALPLQAGSGIATGRRTYEPLVIRKPIDKSSPLLVRALTQNQVIDGVFRFFRPSPSGDGTTQHYYTTEIRRARIVAITQSVTDVDRPGGPHGLPVEEVSFVFPEISWTHEIGGGLFADSFRGNGESSAPSGSHASGAGSAGAAPAGGAGWPDAGSAASVAAPEPLRPTAAERRPPSRVAAIVPLTEAEAGLELAGPA